MRIHEYQAKEILKKNSIPVPYGFIIENEGDAREAAKVLNFPLVLKAQVHSGGRQRAGGVRFVKTQDELESLVRELLGKELLGKYVGKILVENKEAIIRELYLAILIDRQKGTVRFLVSKKGGVEIEELSKEDPSNIFSEFIDVRYGLLPYQIRKLFFFLDLDESLFESFSLICERLYKIFVEYECVLCEINPLAISEKNGFVALDCKMIFDDNALFRHKEIAELSDPKQDDPQELEARKRGFTYVKLKGNVGCIANGAGLAMATVDLVRASEKEPANFLDLGGGATREIVSFALDMVHSDLDVKVLFVNIFGGILKCDTFAYGLADLASKIYKPLIIRLAGTNLEEGLRIIKGLDIPIIFVSDLKEAQKVLKEIRV